MTKNSLGRQHENAPLLLTLGSSALSTCNSLTNFSFPLGMYEEKGGMK
jgi:hypothetical protein